ncbi:hypothetical protein [Mesorhizobium sp.]|uniref:hypothetical protein n=1 Tax=Mesorhizobium sp. TaxID=1871066 RepID=UPI000FE987D8|nr:hypothetical protein [Mesorhizobium sp.]RWO25447.1 MAG: hypothetical protein EOS09_10760 [Mesorhizobium sp.]
MPFEVHPDTDFPVPSSVAIVNFSHFQAIAENYQFMPVAKTFLKLIGIKGPKTGLKNLQSECCAPKSPADHIPMSDWPRLLTCAMFGLHETSVDDQPLSSGAGPFWAGACAIGGVICGSGDGSADNGIDA